VDSREGIISLANHRQSCKFGVRAEPRPSEKLVEYIVSLAIAVRETTADDVYFQIRVHFIGS